MNETRNAKILFFEELCETVAALRRAGKTVVLSHGVFDIIHPGIIRHLTDSRAMGDVLVVTVIKDAHVRRGPGRPVFPEDSRAEAVAALGLVDYVCIVDDDVPFSCIRQINPDIFAKGQAYNDRDRKIHRKIFEEERELYFGKTRILETRGFTFSTTQFINNFLEIYPEEVKHCIRQYSARYSFDRIQEAVDSLKGLKVLIVGDGIVDEYHYTSVLGKSGKANLVVNKYLTHELFAGGALAVANHVASVCDQVTLVTLLGAEDSREDFVRGALKPNIRLKPFLREDWPTVIKRRFVHEYTNQKLFEINYLNERNIAPQTEAQVLAYLEREAPKYDLVLASDFGHGFITPRIIETLTRHAKLLAVNTQTNAANRGFNLVTKYPGPHFVCLDEGEARLAMQDKLGEIGDVARDLARRLGAEGLIVTLGKKGALGVDRQGVLTATPGFSSKVVDTVGAGDAFFSYTALLFARGVPLDMVVFLGNAVGAIAVQVICNKKAVAKHELLEFVHTLLNQAK